MSIEHKTIMLILVCSLVIAVVMQLFRSRGQQSVQPQPLPELQPRILFTVDQATPPELYRAITRELASRGVSVSHVGRSGEFDLIVKGAWLSGCGDPSCPSMHGLRLEHRRAGSARVRLDRWSTADIVDPSVRGGVTGILLALTVGG